jgi:23S rRNA-intervening sequence protein
MAAHDFLNLDIPRLCVDLAGEINKTYQHLPWALKHEAVSRLRRQVQRLSEEAAKAKASKTPPQTLKHLRESASLVHECVPLIDLCLRKNLVSPELQLRWTKRLNEIHRYLDGWGKACSAGE